MARTVIPPTRHPPKPRGTVMNLQDLILVSVDDQAIEPPTAFARHMPAKFKGREPRVQ